MTVSFLWTTYPHSAMITGQVPQDMVAYFYVSTNLLIYITQTGAKCAESARTNPKKKEYAP